MGCCHVLLSISANPYTTQTTQLPIQNPLFSIRPRNTRYWSAMNPRVVYHCTFAWGLKEDLTCQCLAPYLHWPPWPLLLWQGSLEWALHSAKDICRGKVLQDYVILPGCGPSAVLYGWFSVDFSWVHICKFSSAQFHAALILPKSCALNHIRKGARSRKIKLDQTSVVVGMCSMLFYYFQLCFSAGSAAKRRGFHYVAGERPQRTPGREVPSWVPRVLLWFGFGHVWSL